MAAVRNLSIMYYAPHASQAVVYTPKLDLKDDEVFCDRGIPKEDAKEDYIRRQSSGPYQATVSILDIYTFRKATYIKNGDFYSVATFEWYRRTHDKSQLTLEEYFRCSDQAEHHQFNWDEKYLDVQGRTDDELVVAGIPRVCLIPIRPTKSVVEAQAEIQRRKPDLLIADDREILAWAETQSIKAHSLVEGENHLTPTEMIDIVFSRYPLLVDDMRDEEFIDIKLNEDEDLSCNKAILLDLVRRIEQLKSQLAKSSFRFDFNFRMTVKKVDDGIKKVEHDKKQLADMSALLGRYAAVRDNVLKNLDSRISKLNATIEELQGDIIKHNPTGRELNLIYAVDRMIKGKVDSCKANENQVKAITSEREKCVADSTAFLAKMREFIATKSASVTSSGFDDAPAP